MIDNHTILKDIPLQIDFGNLLQKLRVKEGSRYVDEVRRLATEAETVARPKALYKVAYIESKNDDSVVIDGTRLVSRVLRVNLEQAYRVFPYVATCGVELAAWASPVQDVLQHYWADAICELALRQAIRVLQQDIADHYPGQTSAMSPGSLADWPLEQQRALFAVLGDTEGLIGVRLAESCLMIPTKSVSGMRFPTETSFESCQLCPRAVCPGRRAPYDKGLYDRKYAREACSDRLADRTAA